MLSSCHAFADRRGEIGSVLGLASSAIDPNASWPQRCKGAPQIVSLFSHEFQSRFRKSAARALRKPRQNYAGRLQVRREPESTKSLVFSQQDPVFVSRTFDQILIYRTTLRLADGKYAVTVRPRDPHNREIAALIGHEAHFRRYVVRSSTVSCAIVPAAYVSAALTSSAVRCGYETRRSSVVAPSASLRSNSSTGIRVPLVTGLPSITRGLISIRFVSTLPTFNLTRGFGRRRLD